MSKNNGKANTNERAKAKELGLSLVHYRILQAMKAGGSFTYRMIETKTGYYSNLTATMRPSHEGSLGALGLVKELEATIDGVKELSFSITKKGLKVLSKPTKPVAAKKQLEAAVA